jgi:hypothetical protein
MNTWVITFATLGFRDGWVEVTATSENIARAWAAKEYVRWSGIYDKEEFMSDMDTVRLYPLGCLGRATLAYEDVSHV